MVTTIIQDPIYPPLNWKKGIRLLSLIGVDPQLFPIPLAGRIVVEESSTSYNDSSDKPGQLLEDCLVRLLILFFVANFGKVGILSYLNSLIIL